MDQGTIDAKIDSWKEKLLDLTRRNNMVDFSATKTKSLPTKETDWTEIASQLAQDEEVYVWKPDPSAVAVEETSADESQTELQELAQGVVGEGDETEYTETEANVDSDEFSPSANELLSIRDPNETENSLYNISLNQRKYLQEKGVDPLYLALGMLEWFSVDYSDTKLRSPLFLVSVSLERKTVSDESRHDYVLHADDEVILNPALRKKLDSEHDLGLPGDEEFDITELEATGAEIQDEISGFSRWELTNQVILGIFDFAKLGLYNDLEENRDRIKSNPVVQALHGDLDDLNSDTGGVPEAENLDQAVPPVETFQVLEADSSQQVAIEAAKEGVSFVLQGPPGTGKSQTIANIIAEKMATGETILFVSEKQAALDVVKNRLDDVCLGRFCLPAHGKKASKDDVLSSLEEELNAPQIKEPTMRPARMGKLRKRREEINEYGDLILAEYGELDTNAYEAHGILADLEDVPSPAWEVPEPFSVPMDELQTATSQLEQLSAYESQILEYGQHPWTHLTLTTWQLDTDDQFRETIQAQQEVLDEALTYSTRLEAELGVRLESISALENEILPLLRQIQSAPDVEWSSPWFQSSFYEEQDRLTELAAIHRDIGELRDELGGCYEKSFFDTDAQSLHEELAQYGVLRYVSLSYRRLKRRILSHARDEYEPGLADLKKDTAKLMELHSLEERRDEYETLIQDLGPLYSGSETDWELVFDVQSWIKTAADDLAVDLVDVQTFLRDSQADINALVDRATELQEQWEDASAFFVDVVETDSLTTQDGTSLYEARIEDTKATLENLHESIPALKEWVQFTHSLANIEETVASGYIESYLSNDIGPEHLVEGFTKNFYTSFLKQIYAETDLGQFNPSQHEKAIQQFRKLDVKQQELDRVEIQHRVTKRRPSISLKHASSSEQVVLRREIEKQRRRKPLRELFDEAGDMITRLKPCLMMSPLSVAQNLKATSIEFDCVIFDEASQIMPQDAISSVIRAEQAIIAGDTKQLPPTSFFNADTEGGDEIREDLESILEEAAAVLPEKHLRWHYRSRTDELIEFSNRKYYAGRLNTFPENDPDIETGIEFDYVEDGIYDRGGSRQNTPEAQRIVNRIERIAADCPEKSLGVVAFSQAQERGIRDIIEERRDSNPDLDAFVDERDALEGFFVKNLESVQGDERDVMLFSVGYGPDQSGKVTMNFGPLNNDGGERRLNVAVTRARERVIVVSSLLPGDIDLSRTSARGVTDFKHYLEYARQGARVLDREDRPAETLNFDSKFEEAVYDALDVAGHDVETQIQSSGYSIDLAIRHPDRPGEYVLGIECDGAAYHSSKTARDRDRTRQMILEDLGWTIHRIWSPDWNTNRDAEIEEIDEKVQSLIESKVTSDHATADISIPADEAETAEPVEGDGGQTVFEEYTEPDVPSGRDRDFDEISNQTLGKELAGLVESHGPIERAEAFKKVVSQWQLSRVGKSMRRSLNGITTHLDGGRIQKVDGFLWPSGIETVPIRVNNGDQNRSVDEIPIQELAKAAYVILENGIAMEREDLILETARQFGWQRRGSNIQNRIGEAIDLLIDIDAVDDSDQLSATGVDIDQRILNSVFD